MIDYLVAWIFYLLNTFYTIGMEFLYYTIERPIVVFLLFLFGILICVSVSMIK